MFMAPQGAVTPWLGNSGLLISFNGTPWEGLGSALSFFLSSSEPRHQGQGTCITRGSPYQISVPIMCIPPYRKKAFLCMNYVTDQSHVLFWIHVTVLHSNRRGRSVPGLCCVCPCVSFTTMLLWTMCANISGIAHGSPKQTHLKTIPGLPLPN